MARPAAVVSRQRASARRAKVSPNFRVVRTSNNARVDATATAVPTDARRDATRLKLLTAALTAFGLVIVLSASSVVSIAYYGSPWALFERQVMWAVLGIAALAILSRVDLTLVRKLVFPAMCIAGFLLVAVLAPGIGKTTGGSSRWIGAGPINLQPSELAKLCFVLFVADLVARRETARDEWGAIVRPVALVLGLFGILLLKQPDMGSAIVLVCIAASVLCAAGVRGRLLLIVFSTITLVGAILALEAPYRRARLLSFINPFAHASTTGYQVVQSLVTLGSGHLTGTGLAGSPAAWGLLPNAQSDFIFAIIGNELGLVGALGVLVAFAGIGFLGLRIAARAEDRFASLLATGITCWIVCQAFINVGGVIGVLPETGIPLPFLSSGGSALVVALGSIGLLINVAHRSDSGLSARPPQTATRRSATRTTVRSETAKSRQQSSRPIRSSARAGTGRRVS